MSEYSDGLLKEFSNKFEVMNLARGFYELEMYCLSRDPYCSEENYLSHILSSADRVFVLK